MYSLNVALACWFDLQMSNQGKLGELIYLRYRILVLQFKMKNKLRDAVLKFWKVSQVNFFARNKWFRVTF